MPSESPSSNPAPVRLRSVPIERIQPDAVALASPRNLPKPLTSLIGREAEVAAAYALLVDGRTRLLTLTGPGGVGKTRLALRIGEAVAAAFEDGVVFVPLAAIADPDLVLPTIARTLGLREDATRSVTELLADFLRQRNLLLILDNVEQVRSAAVQLAALLAACPDLVILVTSRALLHIAGEQRFPVSPLLLPASFSDRADRSGELPLTTIADSAAVQLFVARAQAVDPAFALSAGNASAVAAICCQLDGLPLAIELAAARIHLLSPSELLTRLGASLPLLTGGPEDAPDRLRTMRQAIAWSYDLLTEAEQTLFHRLAIFVGGWTLAAAEWVAGDGLQVADMARDVPGASPQSATLDLLASLIDKNLVRRTEGASQTRFHMLEVIREFGLERLAKSAEYEVLGERHAEWCVHLAEAVRRAGGLSHRSGLDTLEAEQPNLRAGLAWLLEQGAVPAALHLAGQLAEFWMRRGYWSERQAWLERALAADAGPPTAARAEALVGLNQLLWPRADFAGAARLLGEAERVARAAGDAGALAYARLHQGYVALFRGNFDLAVTRGEESLTNCAAIPQEFSCHGALWLLANATLERGENERAVDLYQHLLAAGRAGGDEISVANSHLGLAHLAERRGELDRALAGYAEAAAVLQEVGQHWTASGCLALLAAAAVALDREESAVRLFAAVDAVRTAIGAAEVTAFPHALQRHEQALATARAALGEERFAAAWAAGAALSLDEAIAEAAILANGVSYPASGASGASAAGLTAREREILRLLAEGRTDKEIAAALGIGRRTVSSHVETIRAKLDAPSRTAAVAIAVRDDLV